MNLQSALQPVIQVINKILSVLVSVTNTNNQPPATPCVTDEAFDPRSSATFPPTLHFPYPVCSPAWL